MVEIKFIFEGGDIANAKELFALPNTDARKTVAFFDTQDRQLFHGGQDGKGTKAILRVRFQPGKSHGKTTLKIRTEGQLDASLQTDPGKDEKREFDFAFGRALLDSYSLNSKQPTSAIDGVLRGDINVQSLFNNEQQALIGDAFPWHTLRVFGPVVGVREWGELDIDGFGHPITFELWDLPATSSSDFRQILEMSTRADESAWETVVTQMQTTLAVKGLKPSSSGTKTQIVLEHFAPGTPTHTTDPDDSDAYVAPTRE